MPTPRILIVDDHIEVRRVLRSALETLSQEFEIVDVPSGEEALVVAASKPVDLLISDLRMAGMSGLELKQKIQKYSPGLKVFLITGITDPLFRQAALEVGADAFFLKPLDMDDFLNAVQAILGIVTPLEALPDPLESYSSPDFDPIARIDALRRELEAVSVLLIDEQARVRLKNGNVPAALLDASLLALLLEAMRSSLNISNSLDRSRPESLMIFPGGSFNLAVAHVGQAYALIIVSEKILGTGFLQNVTPAIRRAANDLTANRSAVDLLGQLGEELGESRGQVREPVDIEGETAAIEALFNESQGDKVQPEDIDSFWRALLEEELPDDQTYGSTLTYEQARQIGLIPDRGLGNDEGQSDETSANSEQ
ncbi:MAG: response regulator [Anaerolineales bacterium]|nr:response regulator [Anaerolineales bacterium]